MQDSSPWVSNNGLKIVIYGILSYYRQIENWLVIHFIDIKFFCLSLFYIINQIFRISILLKDKASSKSVPTLE